MADLGAFFGNPNIQRQGARARALAGQRDVNTLRDPLTYAVMQGLLGTRPDEMGFSVLNPDYEKIKKVAEPAFALGLLGQAAPALAPLTKGLPVGASIKNVGDDLLSYRGSHTAPDSSFGAPLYDLTGGGQMYPADVYSSKAAQIYGGGVPYDQKAFSIAQQYKDKPNALVTIYRAVPKDISNSEKLATLEKQMAAYMKRGTLPKDADNYSSGSKWYDAAYEKREQLRKMPDEPSNDINAINAGDWVTLTKEYAKDHGESALKGEYKILSKKVKAKEVFTNADSIHEFGYQPQVAKPTQVVAPQQEALNTAQKNAALPIEEGGLGLPKDNTPEMRAEAMGGIDAVHFSRKGGDYTELDSGKFAIAPFDAVGTHVGTPQAAMERFQNTVGYKVNNPNYALDELTGSSYPVKVLGDKPLLNQNGMPWGEDDLNTFLRQTGGHNYSDINGGKLTYQDLNADLRKKLFDEQGYTSIPYFNEVEGKGSVSYIVPPKNIRSQFAAFDPMRRNETDILAGLLPLSLLDEEKRKEITSLLE